MNKELKNKISLAMKEDFVGNFVFSADELALIYDEAGFVLRKISGEYGTELPTSDYELVFIALVNLAKEWKSNEDAFFEFIYRRLLGSMSGGGKIYSQIVDAIRSLNKSNKIFMLDCYTKKYYATLCSHSFAPVSSTESFFDMCWEIYCKDLNQQYFKNDPVIKLIANSLYKKFSTNGLDEDDLQIGGNAYSIRVGIRGLAISHKNLMQNLLDDTLKTIDSIFNNEPLKLDKYLQTMINSWWKKKESIFGIEKKRALINREYICTDYTKIRPKYVLEEDEVKLVIPSIRLIDNYESEPYIQVMVNGNCVIYEKMLTHGSGIILTTNVIKYDLSLFEFNFTFDINVRIIHCNKIIYNSNDSLNRDFILFKDSNEIMSLECLPGIYFLYVRQIDKLLQFPQDIHRIGINTYSLQGNDGEVIQSENKSVFFMNEKTNTDLHFFTKAHNDVVFRRRDEEFKVIDGELYVDVSENIDVKDLGVRYESLFFRLSDFEREIINGKKRYAVSTLLNAGQTQHISIFRFSDNFIVASINLIKFNNIRISFDRPLYYGKGVIGKVKFSTDKYEAETEFDIQTSEVALPIEEGEIILYPPILRWKIDNGEWNTEENYNGIWYKEMTNSSIITFDIPQTMKCLVGLNINVPVEQLGTNLSYKIGQTIYYLKENKNYTQDYFTLFIRVENEIYFIAEIYHKECFIKEPFFVLPKTNLAYWSPEKFIGDKDARFRLDIIDSSNRCVFTKELNIARESFFISNIDEGYYTYKITLLGKGFLKPERELSSKKFMLGDEKSFKYKDKIMQITKAMLFDSFEPLIIRPVYIDNIKYLGNKDNFDFYSGMLFIIDKQGQKFYLNYMKNGHGNNVKINPIRIEIKNENSCYLGYGLDPYDKEFEFNDEFTIDSQGKISIGSITSVHRMKGIDYFLFEVI